MKRYAKRTMLLLCMLLVAAGCAVQSSMPGEGQTRIVGPDGQVIVSSQAGETGMPSIEGPGAVDAPADNVLMLEGELEAAQPELALAFPANIKGTLLQIHVELGQKVAQGDLIATLDDSELRQAVEDAQLALDRAQDDRTREETRRATEYQKALAEAQTAYVTAQSEAEIALRNARSALEQAQLKPPTLALRQAEVKLQLAKDTEAAAADGYKQALDRPWEPQQVRDGLYKEWQRRITDRELAEMELQSAQIDARIYNLNLADKQQAVEDAQAKLDGVKLKEVALDTDYTTLERAIVDAEAKLAQAQQNLAQINLYAPQDGLITSIKAAVGASIGSETPVVTLLNVSDWYFVARNLSEKHIAQIQSGQAAKITLRAYPDLALTGETETVMSQIGQSETKFIVYIHLDPGELYLLPGMSGRVEIVL